MIIDSHAHTVAPDALYAFQARLIASRGRPMAEPPKISDADLEASLGKQLAIMDSVGTDIQFTSPRPYGLMHSVRPEPMVRAWVEFNNDVIARQVAMAPERLRGVAALPQFRDSSPANCVEELERCVTELGFIGCLINPDPMEGDGPPPPGMGSEFWYPLYEKMVELDVPGLLHSAACVSERESYTLHFINEESIAILDLVESRVFEDFPDLKLVVPHGGGAIPYQIGRFRSWAFRKGEEPFEDRLRQLYFDTCLYSEDGLELLFKTVGPDRVLFATEKPGTGSGFDPKLGRDLDDLKPWIDELSILTDDDRHAVYEGNARQLYTHAFPATEGSSRG